MWWKGIVFGMLVAFGSQPAGAQDDFKKNAAMMVQAIREADSFRVKALLSTPYVHPTGYKHSIKAPFFCQNQTYRDPDNELQRWCAWRRLVTHNALSAVTALNYLDAKNDKKGHTGTPYQGPSLDQYLGILDEALTEDSTFCDASAFHNAPLFAKNGVEGLDRILAKLYGNASDMPNSCIEESYAFYEYHWPAFIDDCFESPPCISLSTKGYILTASVGDRIATQKILLTLWNHGDEKARALSKHVALSWAEPYGEEVLEQMTDD